MALQVQSITIHRHLSPAEAQVQMMDQDGCIVSVKVKLEGKAIDQFTIAELNTLGLVAAKHVISNG